MCNNRNKIIVEFNRENLEKTCEFDCENNNNCKRTDAQLIKCNLEYISTEFKVIKEHSNGN